MKKALALLVASTALTGAIGVTAWSALGSAEGTDTNLITAVFDDGKQALPLILVSGDDDDEDDDHDDDEADDDGDDGEDDDDLRSGRNPAPIGTVAPPDNGLFGSGTPPRVQVN